MITQKPYYHSDILHVHTFKVRCKPVATLLYVMYVYIYTAMHNIRSISLPTHHVDILNVNFLYALLDCFTNSCLYLDGKLLCGDGILIKLISF